MRHDVYLNWVSTTQTQGYRTECSCGWQGPVEDDREAAQDDGWEHEVGVERRPRPTRERRDRCR